MTTESNCSMMLSDLRAEHTVLPRPMLQRGIFHRWATQLQTDRSRASLSVSKD